MRLARIEHIPFEPRFAGRGYAMSTTRQIVLYNKPLRITLEDGSAGIGETVRWLTYPVADAEAAEAEMQAALRDADLSDLPALISDWCVHGREWRGLCFALDTALHHLASQKLGIPLASLLGAAAGADAATYLSLSSEAPEDMAALSLTVGTQPECLMATIDRTEPIATPRDLIVETEMNRIAPVLWPDLNAIFERDAPHIG